MHVLNYKDTACLFTDPIVEMVLRFLPVTKNTRVVSWPCKIEIEAAVCFSVSSWILQAAILVIARSLWKGDDAAMMDMQVSVVEKQ